MKRASAIALAALWSCTAQAALVPDADDGAIRLPAGFRALVVADNLGPLRFMAVGPTGDIYLKGNAAGILALRDKDGDGRAETRAAFGIGAGTGIAVRDGFLYHSTDSAVYRYQLTPGQLAPGGAAELVVSRLPDENEHTAKAFAFDDAGRLYVEIGSPSNAFGSPDRGAHARGGDPTDFFRTHGGVWRFDSGRLHQRQADGYRYATGLRHLLSLAFNPVSKAFFVVMMGRDQLNSVAPEHYTDEDNAEAPAEELHLLREGGSFGWPFTYWDPRVNARMVAPEYGGDNRRRATPGAYPDPLVAFPAHWAPMQMAFYDGAQFPEKYRGGAFVAFHGSWNRAPKPQKGYNVAFVPFDAKEMPVGGYEVFADGFAGRAQFTSPSDARFRPCGLAIGPDGSLYVADSEKGRVWRIVYTGALAAPTVDALPAAPAPGAAVDPLARAYLDTCAKCHMGDGRGVARLQPALVGNAVLGGDATLLIRLVLFGPDKVLPAHRPRFGNTMPPLASLTNREIADALNYARRRFAAMPSRIAPADVAAQRVTR